MRSCSTKQQDNCSVTTCSVHQAKLTYVSAGKIRIDGGATPIVLEPGVDGTYPVARVPVFTGDEMLSVRAAGDYVPAFERTVRATRDVTVTVPVPIDTGTPNNKAFNFDRTQDLAVAWTGGGEFFVRVSVGSQSPSTEYGIACDYPAAAGSAIVPKAMFSQFPGIGYNSFRVSTFNESVAVTDDWPIAVVAKANGLWPDGTIVSVIMLAHY